MGGKPLLAAPGGKEKKKKKVAVLFTFGWGEGEGLVSVCF